MSVEPTGLHHVTAIASDPQSNVEFYMEVLGLRLVKQTVNYDAPDVYHLYYGDGAGHPGTLLTFFPWPGTPQGRRGAGQCTTTSFSVPPSSLGWWKQRLEDKGVEVEEATTRFDEDALSLHDPDGLLVELVAHDDGRKDPPWEGGPVPEEHQIRALHSVTFTENDLDDTAGLLADLMAFRLVDERDRRFRFDTGEGGPGARVDIVVDPGAPSGLVAAGTVHHVAWACPPEDHDAWPQRVLEGGASPTPVIDRYYFRSIYFREPSGVLFEIATIGPGFTSDEPLETLGEALSLPPNYEHLRDQLEPVLTPLPNPREAWTRR